MIELWLNKAKEVEDLRKHLTIVESSNGIGFKKIMIKNLSLEKIRNIKVIVKDLMNLGESDSELYEEFENLMDYILRKY